jgi:hypothetical protein
MLLLLLFLGPDGQEVVEAVQGDLVADAVHLASVQWLDRAVVVSKKLVVAVLQLTEDGHLKRAKTSPSLRMTFKMDVHVPVLKLYLLRRDVRHGRRYDPLDSFVAFRGGEGALVVEVLIKVRVEHGRDVEGWDGVPSSIIPHPPDTSNQILKTYRYYKSILKKKLNLWQLTFGKVWYGRNPSSQCPWPS